MDKCQRGILLNCYYHVEKFSTLFSNQADLTEFGEIIESFSISEHQTFSNNLLNLITDSVVDINTDFQRVYTASIVLDLYIDKHVDHANRFLECILLIHDNLLQFSNENIFVQNHCSMLLEKWWLKNLIGKEKLAVNVPPYLLARALCPIGKPQEVTRLKNIKEMLPLIDLQHPSSSSLVSLLSLALSNKLFLRNNDGVEFISYVMMLDNELTTLFHQTLKWVIPDLNDTQLKKVGDVYYKAFYLSMEKGCSTHFKKDCLQNLMVCGLKCHRVGNLKAAPQVQKVLSVLHNCKQQVEVEKMLYELYQPLLWRALDVANGHVRANATFLFLDVFPLIPSSFTKVQFQDSLEKQCSKMQELLKDNNEDVRICATKGVSAVLDSYWEILPAHNLKTLLILLCTDMTHDMSSSGVIVAALQGIQLLLNNPLCHVALKKLLPCLNNHIFHPSSTVRVVFLSMLHTLHQTHQLKFWDIVHPEHLLEVLASCKSGSVRKKIVELLLPLYLPITEPLSTQILATFTLLKSHPEVHRYFYKDVYSLIGLSAALKLVVSLLRTIMECIENQKVTIAEDSKLEICLEDVVKITQILETCAILMLSARKDLRTNRKASQNLCKKITSVIPNIMSAYGKDPLCTEALSVIISNLPEEGLVPLKKACYKLCRNKSSSVDVISLSCLSLIRVGVADKILSYLSDGVTTKLTSIAQNNVANPDLTTSVADVSKREDRLTLDVIERLLESELWSEQILHCDEIDTMYCTLLSSSDILLQYQHRDSLKLRSDNFKYLVQCLVLGTRFSIHLGGTEDVVQIVSCVQKITSYKSDKASHLLDSMIPVLVEGFLVLQYNSTFLQHLYNIFTSLTNTQLLQHKLHLCKFLYKAGNFLSQHSSKETPVDLCSVLAKLLHVTTSCVTSIAQLADLKCLLLHLVVFDERQDLAVSKHRPWQGATSVIVDHVKRHLVDTIPQDYDKDVKKSELTSFLQIIVECIRQSGTFGRCFTNVLGSPEENPALKGFVCLVHNVYQSNRD